MKSRAGSTRAHKASNRGRQEGRDSGRDPSAISEITGTIALIAVVVTGMIIVNTIVLSAPSHVRIPSISARAFRAPL